MFSRSCDLDPDLDPTRAGERASEAPWARGISRSRRVREKRIGEARERERWDGSIRSVGRISGTGQTRDEGPAKIKASFDNNGTIPDVLGRFIAVYIRGRAGFIFFYAKIARVNSTTALLDHTEFRSLFFFFFLPLDDFNSIDFPCSPREIKFASVFFFSFLLFK